MERIYVLDLDFKKEKYGGKNSFEHDSVTTVVFNDRRCLVREINKIPPTILLFDLYSKCEELEKGQLHLSDEYLDSKEDKLNSNGELKENQETALRNGQKSRQFSKKLLELDHVPTGIHEMEEVVNSELINISFPIGLFSRYGRHLITTEDMLKVQKSGGYFVYKDKSRSSQDRYKEGFTLRELRSIYDVVDAYRSNISTLDRRLTQELKKISDLEKKLHFNWLSKGIEATFTLAVICAAIIHGKEILQPSTEILSLAELISNFLSFSYLSPFMLVTAFVYLIVIA
ncbi:hypothetical protein ACUWUW_004263, partial [Vibrio vulnificus]